MESNLGGQTTPRLSQTCITSQNKGKIGCYNKLLQDPCITIGRPVMLHEGCQDGLEGNNDEIRGW